MSFEALAWAARQAPGSASRKLVLLALAESASRDGYESWLSIDSICDFSALNRKTVITCLQDLAAAGFITDTGERRGKTRQVIVWRLAVGEALERVPKAEQYQKRNSSVFSRKESQKRYTEPIKEPIRDIPPYIPPSVEPPDWVPADAWRGFCEMRKAKRKPITARAMQMLVTKLAALRDAGHDPGRVLEQSIMNGWTGVFELKDARNGTGHAGRPVADPVIARILGDLAGTSGANRP